MQRALGILTTLLLALFSAPTHAAAQQVQLSLDDAIQMAKTSNPQIKASAEAVASADAARKQARGHYGPSLMLSSNVFFWDDETTLALGSGDASGLSALPAPTTPYEMAFAQLAQGLSQPMSIQDQITSETDITLAMPLSQLYLIHQGYKLSALERDAAQAESRQTRDTVVFDVVSAYFGVLQAKAMLDTAQKSVENLDEQLRVVSSYVEQGMLAKNDLLKVRVARTDSDRTLIEAESNVALAQANLATLIGQDVTRVYLPQASDEHLPKKPAATLDESIRMAMQDRPEILLIEKRAEQADRAKKASIADMFPQVAFVARYAHSEGVSMGRADSFFAGLTLDWTVWEWGASYYAIEKDKHSQNRVELMREYIRNMIRLDVQKSMIDLTKAFKTLDVVTAVVAQASESFDVEKENLALGMGTTADMLDAEAYLAQARNNYAAAVYQCFIAKAAYLRATGQPVTTQTIFD